MSDEHEPGTESVEGREDNEVGLAIAPIDTSPGWLEAAYQDHHRLILHAAYRVTGNSADAEDVLQTVFLRLARRSEPITGSVPSYLHRAAINAGLDMIRSKSAKKTDGLDEVAEPEAKDATDRLLHRHELQGRLREGIAALEGRASQMFVLRYFEDLDNNQIAAFFETTPGTVAVTLHRARKRLASVLGDVTGEKK